MASDLDRIESEYRRLSKLAAEELGPPRPSRPKWSKSLEEQTREVITALDKKGRWVEDDRLRYQGEDDDTSRVIQCTTFIQNMGTLIRYLAAEK